MNHRLEINQSTRYSLNNGKSIPVTGYGVYDIAKEETKELVYQALQIGYRHIDTAVYYGNQVEVAQGIVRFIKDSGVKREDIFFTTKLTSEQQGYDETKQALQTIASDVGSLLGYVDLLLIHTPLTSKEKRLSTWSALEEAVTNPELAPIEIKSIGVSNFGIGHLQELLAVAKIKPVVDQIELHPWLPRLKLREYLAYQDILPEAYSPLTQGHNINDPELLKLEQESSIGKAELLLRWSFLQGFIVLVKSSKVQRIKQNLGVLSKSSGSVSLSEQEWQALDKPDSHEILTWRGYDPTIYRH